MEAPTTQAIGDSRGRVAWRRGYGSAPSRLLMASIVTISGIIYVIVQWTKTGIEDAVFVSMLTAGTLILIMGIRGLYNYLESRGLSFYAFVMSTEDPEKSYAEYQRLCSSVVNFRRMTITGIIYGALVGGSPLILGVWPDQWELRLLLSVFMFAVNFVTGVAFYGLVTFFVHSIRMGAMVQVDLWRIDNPSTSFLLGATRRISVLASVYVSLCISSILFSVLPIGSLILAYSAFAAMVIVASLVVPTFPVMQKMKTAKSSTLLEIDEELQSSFRLALQELKEGGGEIDLGRFEALLELRSKVEAVGIWPFKVRSISAGVSVVFFSSIPVLLQIILERLV